MLIAFCLLSSASALVMTDNTGRWPAEWPKELEPLRASARTIGIATGIQQSIYEIEFKDREEFERAWPAILKVRTPGSTVTLYAKGDPPPESWGALLHNDKPAVRIYAPSESLVGGLAQSADTTSTASGGSSSQYGQFKQDGEKHGWVPSEFPTADPGKATGFIHRARVDLDVVVDGAVIDWDSVVLPPRTPLCDKRLPRLRSDGAPKLTGDQCNLVIVGAHKTLRAAMQQEAAKAPEAEIPVSCWSDVVKAMKPVRVVNDRVNVKLVLKDDGQFESGFYVIMGISSYRPERGDFAEFVELGGTGELVTGNLYWYRQAKGGPAKGSPNTTTG